MKTVVITGIHGQDGGYLAKLLLSKNYTVVGIARRTSLPNDERIKNLYYNKSFVIEYADVTDVGSLYKILNKYNPDEIYNLAAQSHVKESFEQPKYTFDVTFGGVLNILEWLRYYSPKTKLFQASSSEMFGSCFNVNLNYEYDNDGSQIVTEECYQDENTTMIPNSPYAVAKLAAHNLVKMYRNSYNLFACCGIMFNHESPKRGEQFVTRKISKYIAGLKVDGFKEKLKLGNLEASRDWGFAEDTMRAAWMILQNVEPIDYIVSTGETHSVREFLIEAAKRIGLDDKDIFRLVSIDDSLKRPLEVSYLKGCSKKIRDELGWEPKVDFKNLVKLMVDEDIKLKEENKYGRV